MRVYIFLCDSAGSRLRRCLIVPSVLTRRFGVPSEARRPIVPAACTPRAAPAGTRGGRRQGLTRRGPSCALCALCAPLCSRCLRDSATGRAESQRVLRRLVHPAPDGSFSGLVSLGSTGLSAQRTGVRSPLLDMPTSQAGRDTRLCGREGPASRSLPSLDCVLQQRTAGERGPRAPGANPGSWHVLFVSANQPLTPLNLSVLSVKRGNNNNNTVLLRDVWGEKMHMEAFRKI